MDYDKKLKNIEERLRDWKSKANSYGDAMAEVSRLSREFRGPVAVFKGINHGANE